MNNPLSRTTSDLTTEDLRNLYRAIGIFLSAIAAVAGRGLAFRRFDIGAVGSGAFSPHATVFGAVLALSVWLGGSASHAQGLQSGEGVELNNSVPRDVRDVTVQQNLGGQIPKTLSLVDSQGRKVKSARYFDGEIPTIVTLNYSDCPMLCSVQLNALTESLDELDLKLGEDFRVLTVSIDPKEPTRKIRETKQRYVGLLRNQSRADEGWAFCTASQAVITKLTDVLGFRYTYDEATGEYYHAAMLAFVSPDGVITRYSLAVNFPPDQLKLALVEAGDGQVGGAVDQFILWCYSFDPNKNSYVPQAWRIMRLGGALTLVLMLLVLTPYWIGRKRHPREGCSAHPPDDAGRAASSDPMESAARI